MQNRVDARKAIEDTKEKMIQDPFELTEEKLMDHIIEESQILKGLGFSHSGVERVGPTSKMFQGFQYIFNTKELPPFLLRVLSYVRVEIAQVSPQHEPPP